MKNSLEYDPHHLPIPLYRVGQIYQPKHERSLSIRRTQDFNAALLTKLGWKILTDLNNIWVKVALAKYLCNVNFIEAKKCYAGSLGVTKG